MVNSLLKIFDFFQQKRRLCMVSMAIVTGILLTMLLSLRYSENITDFLPLSGDEQKAITLYQDISGGQRIITMFKAKEGETDDSELLTEAIDTFSIKLQSSHGKKHISEVTTQVDFDKLTKISEFVYQNIPLMLVDSDYVRMEEIISSPESFDEQLANDVQMIMMPATGFFTSNISNDPLGLFTPVLERLQAKQSALSYEIDNGYVYTPGRKYALTLISSPYGAMETANNSLLVHYVDSIAQETMHAFPSVTIESTGSPVIAVGNANQIKKDSQWAISIATTLILLLLLFSFRRVKNIILIGVAIAFGWLFAMGFTAVLRSDVSLIVLGIGSIIIGIAVNYPLHFIAHSEHKENIREVLKEMIPPLLTGNITTIGAFASLIPLDAPALRDLGLFAVFMLAGTIFFVLIFLPHLIKKSKKTEKTEHLSFGKLSTMSTNRHGWMFWSIIVLTLIFGYFSLGTSFDANMHHVNYMTEEQKELLKDLRSSTGINDTANVYVVTEAESWDQALNKRTQLAPLLDSLKNTQNLVECSDVTTFVCSRDEQKRRIGMWNRFWDKHRTDVLLHLKEKAPQYGFSIDAFDCFEEIVNNTYSVHDFKYFEPLTSTLLSNSISKSTGNCSVVDIINVGDKDIEHLETLLNNSLDKDGYAFDFAGMNSAMARSLSDNFNYIGFACGFIVFLFLWLSFGRLELSLLAFLPMALGWIWILGIMNLLGMQFNIVNVILATFIFGQGDDYTIFITDGLINEYAYRKKILQSYKNSIIISALIMFIGMGALIIAKHPALYSLGEVTIVGMFTVVLMAWVVPPIIFNWMVRKDDEIRTIPITLEQIIRTSYCAVCYISELCYGCLIGFFVKLIPGKTGERWFHKVIQKTMRININHIWGVKSVIRNDYDESFNQGGIIICNHQSILDPIYLLSLSPNILVVMNEKVWRNPIVHLLFKLAGYMSINQPIETLKKKIATAIANGYNVVIFPEGKRTDNRIRRFHKGATYFAQEIGADLLPVFLHGSGHVMPKGSALGARGRIDIEVGKRVTYDQLSTFGNSTMAISHSFQHMYKNRYEEMRREIENAHYFHHYVIYKYIYKGIGVEKETKRLLKQYDDFSRWIDNYTPSDTSSNVVSIIHAGKGQFSLMFAYVHPELEVNSYTTDPDDAALASTCEPLPSNLHIHCIQEKDMPQKGNIINLSIVMA